MNKPACKIVIFFFWILSINCFAHKNFRTDKKSIREKSFFLESSVFQIEKDSIFECYAPFPYGCGVFTNPYIMEDAIQDSTRLYLEKNLYKKTGLAADSLKEGYIIKLRPVVDRQNPGTFSWKNFQKGLLMLSCFLLCNNDFPETQHLYLSIEKNGKVLFTSQTQEESIFRVSPWYIFLLDFYSARKANETIFYEQAVTLLNEATEKIQAQKK